MYQGKLLETRDIKLINALMVQVFFGTTQMNGLLQQKFQKLTPIVILKSKGWQLPISLAKTRYFVNFGVTSFKLSEKEKSACISDVV